MINYQRRKYDKDFKHNAVSLYFGSGKSYDALGEELGIPASTLVGWVKSGKYGSQPEAKIFASNLEELKELRKELASVREERNILKKALTIFLAPKDN